MKILQIIESAFRGTLEEQDDAVIWLTHAMKGAGGDLTVLLRGNAVASAAKGQDASGLSLGDWKQTQPPDIEGQVGGLVGKGVEVYYIEEEAAERGLKAGDLIDGLKPISRDGLAGLLGSHDQVWHW